MEWRRGSGHVLWHERQGMDRPGVIQPLVEGPLPAVCCARPTPTPIAWWPQLTLWTSKHWVGTGLGVLSYSAYHLTPRRIHSHWTAQCFGLSSATGPMLATTSSSKTLEWWSCLTFQGSFQGLGWRPWLPRTSWPGSRSVASTHSTVMPFQFLTRAVLAMLRQPTHLQTMVTRLPSAVWTHLPSHLRRSLHMREDTRKVTTSMMIHTTWHGLASIILKQCHTMTSLHRVNQPPCCRSSPVSSRLLRLIQPVPPLAHLQSLTISLPTVTSSYSLTATIFSISPPDAIASPCIPSPQAAHAVMSPSISCTTDATTSPSTFAVGLLSSSHVATSPNEPDANVLPLTSIPHIAPSDGRNDSTPLQKYLHLPITVKAKKTPVVSSDTRAITGARVLTSVECLAIIKNEMKKRQDKEERRRKQREEKHRKWEEEKQQWEEEKRKKAEQKRQKAEKRIQREAEKAKKVVSHTGKQGQSVQGTHEGVDRRGRTPAKRSRLEDETIFTDKCCVCYQAFQKEIELGAGTEWVQCVCTYWLHEDCIVDCILDCSGKEKLCQ